MNSAPVTNSANVRIFATISSTVHDRNRSVAKRLKRDTPEGRAAVEQLVWSQIHGHAHLMIDGKLKCEGGTGHGRLRRRCIWRVCCCRSEGAVCAVFSFVAQTERDGECCR